MQLEGLHHVTAITGDASLNVAFYTQVLGLHLVKKTVNQDDVSAYHLFYGDETGSPGTELTFFDWPMAGPQRPGAGTISAIAFGVNGRAALEWWVQRFDSFKVSHDGNSRSVRGAHHSKSARPHSHAAYRDAWVPPKRDIPVRTAQHGLCL